MIFLEPEVVKEVFIHELGHLLAIRYSEKWNNIKLVENFFIRESKSNEKYKCLGGVATREDFFKRLRYKEQIGIKLMGCVFQAIKSNTKIEGFLLSYGEVDRLHIREFLKSIKRRDRFKNIVDITNDFISISIEEMRLLFNNTIGNIEHIDYFDLVDENEYENEYEIDMIELDKHLLPLFDFYEYYYKAYLEKIEKKLV